MSKHGDTDTGPTPTDLTGDQRLPESTHFVTKVRTWTVEDMTPGEIEKRADKATVAAFEVKDPATVTLAELVELEQIRRRQER